MSYFTEDFVKFFKQLEKNNNRDWFKKNKSRYEESVKKPFEAFIEEMIRRIHDDDSSINTNPKDSIFRIYRDVRFSPDKRPYKTQTSAIIASGGRKEMREPGHYIELTAKEIRFYGGLYIIEKNDLQMIREYISVNLNKFNRLISDKDFRKVFKNILGEQHKRIPAVFKKAADKQPLLANKQFYFFAKLDSKELTNKKLTDKLMKYYFISKPLNQFFRHALK